jgi:DNA-binding ferritin-like protein
VALVVGSVGKKPPEKHKSMEMTKTLFDDPKYWRAHAAQIRAQAEQMGDPDAKRMMLEIAANYDALGNHAHERSMTRAR